MNLKSTSGICMYFLAKKITLREVFSVIDGLNFEEIFKNSEYVSMELKHKKK